MTRIKVFGAWMGEGIVLRRWHYIAVSAALGLAVALGIGGVVGLRRERDTRIAQAQRETEARIKRELITRQDVIKISTRTAKLERPSDAEIAARVAHALRLLSQRPSFQRRFGVTVVSLKTPGKGVVTLTPTPPAPHPQQPTPKRPPVPTPRPSPAPSPSPAPGGGSHRPPTSPPPPPPPHRPIVDIHTPPEVPILPGVHFCTGLISINCDDGATG